MRKQIIAALFSAAPILLMAQAAPDAYQISQQDLRGTARFMSMAGAFGALGGDISTLNQNPAGIGVYRNSDVAATIDFDIQSTQAENQGMKYGSVNQFKVACNNVGYVGSYATNSDVMPYFNWGFSYNKSKSFNRHYSGGISNLGTSLTNYIAGVTNSGGYSEKQLAYSDGYNPYVNGNAPWLSILAYDSYLINGDSNGKSFQGLYGDGTTGRGEFETVEEGGIDQYSINFGGNIANMVYWGLGFGIADVNYRSNTYYGESLNNAYIYNEKGVGSQGYADWGLVNSLRTTGTGYNFKLGLIVKPVNEFRLGFAFHTPTYYSLKDEAYATTSYAYGNGLQNSSDANDGYGSVGWYKIHSPWRFIASAAGVIGNKAIVSFDYEYVGFQTMEVLSDNGTVYNDTKQQIGKYYKPSNIYRIGIEYKVTPQLSLRGGYSYQSSPVTDQAYSNRENIITAGTTPSYSFDNKIEYITAGLGYRYQSFYTDLAYVHKTRKSEYHAFSPEVNNAGSLLVESPSAKITDSNNQIVWTIGFRF